MAVTCGPTTVATIETRRGGRRFRPETLLPIKLGKECAQNVYEAPNERSAREPDIDHEEKTPLSPKSNSSVRSERSRRSSAQPSRVPDLFASDAELPGQEAQQCSKAAQGHRKRDVLPEREQHSGKETMPKLVRNISRRVTDPSLLRNGMRELRRRAAIEGLSGDAKLDPAPTAWGNSTSTGGPMNAKHGIGSDDLEVHTPSKTRSASRTTNFRCTGSMVIQDVHVNGENTLPNLVPRVVDGGTRCGNAPEAKQHLFRRGPLNEHPLLDDHASCLE